MGKIYNTGVICLNKAVKNGSNVKIFSDMTKGGSFIASEPGLRGGAKSSTLRGDC